MRTRTKKLLHHENKHYLKRITNNGRLWFDQCLFDDDESDFDPYNDFDPFDYMFCEDEYEYV